MAAPAMPSPSTIAVDRLGFFRWGRVAGKVLLSTDGGDWLFLDEPEFADLLAGRVTEGHPRFAALQAGGFLVAGLDLDALAGRLARRVRHVARGPERHVVTVTGPGAAPGGRTELDRATAERIVDVALQTSSPSVSFELHGHTGEPLLHVDGVRHLTDYARAANKRAAGKSLAITVVTNLTAMTDETAEWLVANDVAVRTWLDGPAALHDANRRWTSAGPHADVVRWLESLAGRQREVGREPGGRIAARPTITRPLLGAWREQIDEYVARGLRSIALRPLVPIGVDPATWRAIGYTAGEYLAFYERAFTYVLELNRRGVDVAEEIASAFLHKMLASGDPSVGDVQSPCPAGTSEVAYDAAGGVFPGDDARRMAAAGDPLFALGSIRDLTLAGVARHPTVRAIAAASLLDAQPMCADCWNKPFCGVSPVATYARDGDLFGHRPSSFECKEHMAIARTLFGLLANEADAETRGILERWTAGAVR